MNDGLCHSTHLAPQKKSHRPACRPSAQNCLIFSFATPVTLVSAIEGIGPATVSGDGFNK